MAESLAAAQVAEEAAEVELQNTLVQIAALQADGQLSLDAYPQGTKVWLPDADHVWVGAVCFEAGPGEATFQLDSGQFVHVKAGRKPGTVAIQDEEGKAKTYPLPEGIGLPPQNVGELTLAAINDLTKLAHLHEPAILHFLGDRFQTGRIYTYTGAILIAVNPWKWLPGIYDPSEIDRYEAAAKSGSQEGVAPHIFATAAAAYAAVVKNGKSQSILVSGESGAGKTETCKQLIKYFARVATTSTLAAQPSAGARRPRALSIVGGKSAGIEQRVIDCNPLLEAFGNARTPRNDNSSRFGKFTSMGFTGDGSLCGAEIDTYLLEKSRVVRQDPGNCTFHIFLQLCAGESAITEPLGLREPSQHAFTASADLVSSDVGTELATTIAGLATAGVKDDDRESLFQVLAAILHLGDIQFESADGTATISGDLDDPLHPIATAVRLLQVDGTLLSHALVSREMHVAGDTTTVALRAEQAAEARDSLAKALYSKVFDWIVRKINASFGHGFAEVENTIGLLDIFGFEYFGDDNSYEQLCINYANEKIQQVFNAHVFKLEQKEYERERIAFSEITFTDNQGVLDIFEGVPGRQGFFKLLDEQCKLPDASNEGFVDRWIDDSKTSEPVLSAHRFGRGRFVISHFAADVTYSCAGFMDKNRDNIHGDLIPAVQSSSNALVKALFPRSMRHRAISSASPHATSRAAKTKLFTATVGSQFAGQLRGMMVEIEKTELHFIRCINPNSSKRPGAFDNRYVVDQVRCNGLLDAVHVMREMYGTRIVHQQFFDTYFSAATRGDWLPVFLATPESRALFGRIPTNPANFDVLREACGQLCLCMGLTADDFKIGRSKVFLKSDVVAKLGQKCKQASDRDAAMIQAVVRARLQRTEYIKERNAALMIQRMQRMHAAIAKKNQLQLEAMEANERELFLQREAEAKIAAARALEARRNAAATKIAAVRRGQVVRRNNKIHRSIGIIEEKNKLLQQVVAAREDAEQEAEANTALRMQLTQLRTEVDQTKKSLQESQVQNKTIAQDYAELEADRNQIADHLDQTTDKLESRERELAFIEDQNEQLKAQLAGQGGSLGALQVEKVRLEEELHSESEHNIQANARIETLILELEKSEAENENISSKLDAANEECEALRQALSQAQAEIVQQESLYRSLEKKNTLLVSQLELANNQIHLLTMKNQAAAQAARSSGAGSKSRLTVPPTSAAARAAVVMPAKIDIKDSDVSVDDVRAVLSDPHTIMTGYLDKRKKSVSGWKKRFFVLKRNSLLYYKDESMQNLKGLIWTETCRVENRIYVPEKTGWMKNKDDLRRADREVLMVASSSSTGSRDSMYLMPADDGGDLDLQPWLLQLRLIIARATYIKQEEALATEPDSRILNFLDECTIQQTLALSHGELGLEAAVCLGAILPFSTALSRIEVVEAAVDDLQLAQLVRPLAKGFPSLNSLSLGGNMLTSDSANHLVTALASRDVPLVLSLRNNKFGDDGCVELAKLLTGTVLVELDLSGNLVGEAGAGAVCAAIATNTSLTNFKLNNNPLRGAGCDHVADMLRKNTSIVTLGMSSCGLTDKSAQSLSDALCSNTSLIELDVSSNSITNDGATTFSAMLQVNDTVKTIHLSSNILANFVPQDALVVSTTDQLVRTVITVQGGDGD